MGIDQRLVELVWTRYDEALGAHVTMNCDGCLYRTPLPGYEDRVGTGPG
jgi:sirohydrochlorin cobaltochelatase